MKNSHENKFMKKREVNTEDQQNECQSWTQCGEYGRSFTEVSRGWRPLSGGRTQRTARISPQKKKVPSKMRTTESRPKIWQQSSYKRRPGEDTEPKWSSQNRPDDIQHLSESVPMRDNWKTAAEEKEQVEDKDFTRTRQDPKKQKRSENKKRCLIIKIMPSSL